MILVILNYDFSHVDLSSCRSIQVSKIAKFGRKFWSLKSQIPSKTASPIKWNFLLHILEFLIIYDNASILRKVKLIGYYLSFCFIFCYFQLVISSIVLSLFRLLRALEASEEGLLNVGDKSSPEDIWRILPGLSKAQYKAGIGALLRWDGLGTMDENIAEKDRREEM